MVLIQHLYGLPLLRRTAEEVPLNVAYRWSLGYALQEETPYFSTASDNFRHRFTEETADHLFTWILEEAAGAGYLSPKAVLIDGTHINANANTKKRIKEQIPGASKLYARGLREEVYADREAHGKPPFDEDDQPLAAGKKPRDNTAKKKLARRKKAGFKTVTRSVTNSDCGLFVKGEHKRQFAYKAHSPTRALCTHARDYVKTIQRHIWKDWEELAGGRSIYAGVRGAVQAAKRENRARVCRWERKARHAQYTVQRLGPSDKLGDVEICCHESEKAGKLEVEGVFVRFAFPLFQPCFSKNPATHRA